MTSRRERLADLLDRTRATELAFRVRSHAPSNRLSILTYHSVGTVERDYPYDPEVIDATPEQFDEQLAVLSAHFSVVGIDDLMRAREGERLPPNAVLITFDDGYRSCRDVALPILQRHGLRATFFIATRFITERRVYWWDRVRYLISQSERRALDLNYPRAVHCDLGAQAQTARTLLGIVKGERGLDLERFLTELAEATGVAWNEAIERRIADQLIMTWDDLRAMRDAGMDLESHTRSHRVLTTLAPADLGEELAGSRAELERELDIPVRGIAYPVGRPLTDQPALLQAIREAGYQLGFTNASGINRDWRRVDPFDVRRLAMDRGMSQAMFRSQLAFPALAYTR